MQRYPAELARGLGSCPPPPEKSVPDSNTKEILRTLEMYDAVVQPTGDLTFDQLLQLSPLIALVAMLRMLKDARRV